jgi:hypothetical protein
MEWMPYFPSMSIEPKAIESRATLERNVIKMFAWLISLLIIINGNQSMAN